MLTKVKVKDFMTTKFVTLKTDMDIIEAIKLLMHHRITGAPVTDPHGNVVGMFTEVDGMRVVLDSAYNQNFGGKVEEYMSKEIPAIDAETSIVDAAEKFSKTTARNFPVMADVELVGVISRVDVLRALLSLK
jgi:predicted transcriptional regulator